MIPPLVGIPARAVSLGLGGGVYAHLGLDDTMNETYGSDPNFPAYLSPYNDDSTDGFPGGLDDGLDLGFGVEDVRGGGGGGGLMGGLDELSSERLSEEVMRGGSGG
tara:strand:- start:214 stop:531 length:318 start_codon:yes stop_codon:yes gene_type:complete